MIRLIDNVDALKSWRFSEKISSLGFVPTMGNLHRGHLSLVEKSLKENEQTVVSIFVNPLQFSANEDFNTYPRTLEKDLETLKSFFPYKSLIVFAPQQFYPKNFSTIIKVENTLVDKLCGKSRPHHFAGVTTVVYLLFSFVCPSKAYFGQKDYQQFKIIEKMTHDLNFPILLEMMPIVRDACGLALSSRNQNLSPKQYNEALTLNKTLKKIASTLSAKTEPDWHSPPSGRSWDYLNILDATNLETISPQTKQILIAGALRVGGIRLIDNIIINKYA